MSESERPISEQEADIINWMLRYSAPSGRLLDLAKCVPNLHVVDRCDCGCPTVTFEKTEDLHPIADALGKTPGGSVGLILWGRDDAICGLEVYSMEDTTNCTLPTVDNLLPWPTA